MSRNPWNQSSGYGNKLRRKRFMKQVSFEWKSDGVMDNKTGEGEKDEIT